jgi:hypothetical protein
MSSELLAHVLDAHGGLANWNHVSTVTAEIAVGRPFWAPEAGRTWRPR